MRCLGRWVCRLEGPLVGHQLPLSPSLSLSVCLASHPSIRIIWECTSVHIYLSMSSVLGLLDQVVNSNFKCLSKNIFQISIEKIQMFSFSSQKSKSRVWSLWANLRRTGGQVLACWTEMPEFRFLATAYQTQSSYITGQGWTGTAFHNGHRRDKGADSFHPGHWIFHRWTVSPAIEVIGIWGNKN